jgi:hypothetical protein
MNNALSRKSFWAMQWVLFFRLQPWPKRWELLASGKKRLFTSRFFAQPEIALPEVLSNRSVRVVRVQLPDFTIAVAVRLSVW